MTRNFINNREYICTDPKGLDQLTDVQKAQLKIAYKLYCGEEIDDPHQMFDQEREFAIYSAEYWDILDGENDQLKYQFWMINSDSGTVFFANEARAIGIEMIQAYFNTISGDTEEGESKALQQGLFGD